MAQKRKRRPQRSYRRRLSSRGVALPRKLNRRGSLRRSGRLKRKPGYSVKPNQGGPAAPSNRDKQRDYVAQAKRAGFRGVTVNGARKFEQRLERALRAKAAQTARAEG